MKEKVIGETPRGVTRLTPIAPRLTPIASRLSPHASHLTELPPLALYVHIPWCLKKCPYCDFNSHELKDELPEAAYIDAVLGDLEQALPAVWGRRLASVFIGGGTPSLFSPAAIERLLSGIRAALPLNPYTEVTLEANPGTFEADKFRVFRDLGINRLSLGVQSFNPEHLAALGRVHTSDEAKRAIEFAAKNFDNFNLDLMYALPRQTLAQALADIDTALGYTPPHLSAYHLTLEPNTLFHRYPPPLPDDDLAADMQEAIEEKLSAAGYGHYETSAFARPGREARHNVNYWEFGDYLGIGAGAHSKISFPDRIVRELRHKQPRAYMESVAAGAHIIERHEVDDASRPFEFMMNALRLTGGFPTALFAERTGLPITAIARELAVAEERGLLERDHVTTRPTLRGQRFLNDLLQIFLEDGAAPRAP
jgi:putative oxygen-independent coproporphyrinogen III oxidase